VRIRGTPSEISSRLSIIGSSFRRDGNKDGSLDVRGVSQLVSIRLAGERRLLVEAPRPSARVAVAVAVIERVAGAVMGMSHDLVGHVLAVREELLQADDAGEQKGDLGEEKSLADQKGERFEGEAADQADLEDGCGDQRSHVVLLAATCKRRE